MIFLFICGFFFGIIFIIFLFGIYFFNIFGRTTTTNFNNNKCSIQAADKARIPPEIKAFLNSSKDGNGSEWESCSSFSLLLHFLFQEIKDTRQFRRWLYKKLQLELNDATARSSTAGRIIQDIQIRDLEIGTHPPMIKDIKVSEFKLNESDPDMFDELVLMLNLDYKGGFQMSVDALMAFGKFAQLSVKLLELKGKARLTITRQPFAHWSICFVENPQMNLKIDSQFQGRNLRHLIPLITTAFRKLVQLKHVWPNYKIRFRPFFQNPLFNISPNIEALDHIHFSGSGLEVTVLCSSRLNISLRHGGQHLFCKVFLEKRPFGCSSFNKLKGTSTNQISSNEELHLQSLMLSFSRKGINDKIGLTLGMKNGKDISVEKVETNSNAEKSGFKVGDILIAVNNIAVRSERQAIRLLSGTCSDLLILVERKLEEKKNNNNCSSSLQKPSKSVDDFILLGAQPIEFRAEDLPEFNEEEKEEEKNIGKCLFKSASDSIELLLLSSQTKRGSVDYSSPNINSNKEEKCEEQDKQIVKQVAKQHAKQVGEIVGKQVGNKIGEQVGENVGKKVEEQVVKQVGEKIVKNVGKQVGEKVEKQVVKNVEEKVGENTEKQVGKQVGDKNEKQVGEKVGKQVVNKNEEKQGESDEKQVAKQVGGKLERNEGSFRLSSIKKKKKTLRRSRSESSLSQTPTTTNNSRKTSTIMQNVVQNNEDNTNCKSSLDVCVDDTSSITSCKKPENVKSKRERLHAKANEMAKHWQAGRSKINELWNRRKPSELAIEVNDDMEINEHFTNVDRLCTPTREENKLFKKKLSPSPSCGKNVLNDGEKRETTATKSEAFLQDVNMQKTKQIPLTKDPLWGQSLHFTLQNESLYLNVLVCADAEGNEKDSCELVGFTSIYVPRIIDDCTLTLSNSHRERFHLKGPKERENILPQEFEELSKHNGFDPRLCFGDIILGFRFFPDGLPNSLIQQKDLLKKDEEENKEEKQQKENLNQQPQSNNNEHKWINLQPKHGLHFSCFICSGKIWLKGGSRCEKCLIICHTNNKCLDKAKACECTKIINPSNFNDDEAFEELVDFNVESPTRKEAANYSEEQKILLTTTNPLLNQPNILLDTDNKIGSGCRRRRIAEKLQTTMSTLKQVGGGIRKRRGGGNISEITTTPREEIESTSRMSTEPPESPPPSQASQSLQNSQGESQIFIAISDVLDRDFFNSLEGFPKEINIDELRFEPGNAYNPQVICETKTKGKLVFGNLPASERKLKINSQIDRVQTMIERVTRERRSLPCKNDEDFDIVDNRLQALALVMLLYCSGLSDCMDKEEAETTNPKNLSNKGEEID
ncbi:unnamed protein product [Meloidogyne enterolobii]|uniref:Uncharacterized protein n=1 Tax=Meloidogyne enterolobii TaxID=390850 RepID=A0ACB0Y7A3_MELEN